MEVSARSQIAITLSEGRRTATTVEKQVAFCEDRSEAEGRSAQTIAIVAVFAWPYLRRQSLPYKKKSSKTAQKSHVKPQNDLYYSNKTRSSWHVSSTQFGILKTVEK
jgi:hypothetical protein